MFIATGGTPFKFAPKLYKSAQAIHRAFRSHDKTILQLCTEYKVGQETMRQFLIISLGDEYHAIVSDNRRRLKQTRQGGRSEAEARHGGRPLHRTIGDLSADELAVLRRKLQNLQGDPCLGYHAHVVSPLMGDV
jgi:hypothetical protein